MSKVVEFGFGVIDYTDPNIFRYTTGEMEMSLEQVDELYDKYHELLDNSEEPFIFLSDVSKSKWVNNEVRIKIGKKVQELENKYEGRFKKSYIVLPNAIMKMMLKGVNIVSKPKVPQEIFSTIDEAEKAAKEEIANW